MQQFVTYEFITGNYPVVISACSKKFWLIFRVFQTRKCVYPQWQEYLDVVGAYGTFKSGDLESLFLPYATTCTPLAVLQLFVKLWNKPSRWTSVG